MKKLFVLAFIVLGLAAPSAALAGPFDGADHAAPTPAGWSWDWE